MPILQLVKAAARSDPSITVRQLQRQQLASGRIRVGFIFIFIFERGLLHLVSFFLS